MTEEKDLNQKGNKRENKNNLNESISARQINLDNL